MKIDKYGHCVVCGINLIIEEVIDGKVQTRFLPQKDSKRFLLSDGSQMRVCICKKCKQIEGNEDDIMQAVFNGWKVESDKLVEDTDKPQWTNKKRNEYLDRMAKLKIISNAEGKDLYILRNEFKRYRNIKDKKTIKEVGKKWD